jgi:glycosyltransferase involved in cell wall biosynthesis
VLLKAMKFGEPHSSAYQQAMSDLNAFQFVVRSVPKGSESLIQPKLAIAMLALAPSFADVRTKDPLALLGALPGVRTHYFERDFSIPNYPIELPKVVIVQRQLVMDIPGWRASLDKLHERGWAVIAEWDDHPDLFAPEIRAKFDKHPWASVLMADAVQVSTPSLAEHIEAIARREHRELNLKVVENKVLSLGYAPRSALAGRRLKVFLGALNRWADFRLLIEAIQSVKGLADRLEFTIISNDSQAQPIEGLKVIPPCSRQDYLKHLGACDVCLCPLSDSEANRCKSPVKWLEASSMGVVTLASAVVYGEVIRHDEDGLLFHTPQGAAQLLEGLVADPSRITRLREAATLRMKADFMLVDDLQPRIDWYLQVAEKLSLR